MSAAVCELQQQITEAVKRLEWDMLQYTWDELNHLWDICRISSRAHGTPARLGFKMCMTNENL
jgi:hypothetical protein